MTAYDPPAPTPPQLEPAPLDTAAASGPATASPRRPGAHLLLWPGLAVVALLQAYIHTHHVSGLPPVTAAIVVSTLYAAVFLLFGLLSRRGGLVGVAVLPWLLAAVIFGALQFTYLGILLPLVYVLYNAAYLVVRRTAALGYLFLLLTAVLEFAWASTFGYGGVGHWFYGYGSWGSFALSEMLAVLGATALLAPATLFAAMVTRSAERSRPAPVPWGQPPYGYAPNGPGPVGSAPYPPAGYAPNGYAPNGYAPNGYPPAGYAPNGYAPAGYGYPPQAPRTNGLSIAALVLGIVGVSLGGVICGHIALSQIRRTGEGGRGMAIAGIVLGYVWIAVCLVFIVVAFSAASQYGGY